MFVFFFKQKTVYEMRISDWSSDVCSSDLLDDKSYAAFAHVDFNLTDRLTLSAGGRYTREDQDVDFTQTSGNLAFASLGNRQQSRRESQFTWVANARYSLQRSEEHTSELQSLMRISYAVFCLKKKNNTTLIMHMH